MIYYPSGAPVPTPYAPLPWATVPPLPRLERARMWIRSPGPATCRAVVQPWLPCWWNIRVNIGYTTYGYTSMATTSYGSFEKIWVTIVKYMGNIGGTSLLQCHTLTKWYCKKPPLSRGSSEKRAKPKHWVSTTVATHPWLILVDSYRTNSETMWYSYLWCMVANRAISSDIANDLRAKKKYISL